MYGMAYRFLGRCKAGMGDIVQLGCVIKHLKHYSPDMYICIETKPGLSPILAGIADESHDLLQPQPWKREPWDVRHYFPFERPSEYWQDRPNTKVSECLALYFPELKPIEKLYRYSIKINEEARARADRWIKEELNNKPFAIVHPWGTASPDKKNLTDWEVFVLCGMIVSQGLVPVVLFFDWPVPDCLADIAVYPDHTQEIWQDVAKKKTGNAQVIAALIDRAEIFFGIDSGPAHLAGCSPIKTPAHILWHRHHPITCFDLSGNPNLLHHVDEQVANRESLTRDYFESHYKYTYYDLDLTDYIEDLFRSVVYG